MDDACTVVEDALKTIVLHRRIRRICVVHLHLQIQSINLKPHTASKELGLCLTAFNSVVVFFPHRIFKRLGFGWWLSDSQAAFPQVANL